MIKAILFDLDNTLIDRDAAFRGCVHAQFSQVSVREEILALDGNGHGDRTALFRLWEERSGTKINQSLLGRMIAERISPDPGLLTELKALSARAKIGLISNGSSDAQRRKLQAAHLDAVFRFDRIWISEEVGYAKPDVRIFEHAARWLAERPNECLYFGDREDHDLRGASDAGLRAHLVTKVLTGPRLQNLLREFGK